MQFLSIVICKYVFDLNELVNVDTLMYTIIHKQFKK